jgi:Cupredoxin-like domain
VVLGIVVVLAFLIPYVYAMSTRANVIQGSSSATSDSSAGFSPNPGGSPSRSITKGAATLTGGVQKIAIDLTQGSYSPNYVTAKAGTPIEMDFKGPTPSCNGTVIFQALNIDQDMSNGGVLKLGALPRGTYGWACSMGMFRGQLVVN